MLAQWGEDMFVGLAIFPSVAYTHSLEPVSGSPRG
jgi:hypothetical protein